MIPGYDNWLYSQADEHLDAEADERKRQDQEDEADRRVHQEIEDFREDTNVR